MPSALAGWMKGWTELGMPPERLSLKLGSLRELGLLQGSSGSRRPRWKMPLLVKAKPGTGTSSHLVKAVTGQPTCTGTESVTAFVVIFHPKKMIKIRAAS